jgi:hypothetical protein
MACLFIGALCAACEDAQPRSLPDFRGGRPIAGEGGEASVAGAGGRGGESTAPPPNRLCGDIPLPTTWEFPAVVGTPCEPEGQLQPFSGVRRSYFGADQFACQIYLCSCQDGKWACAGRLCAGTQGNNDCSPAVEAAFDCQCSADGKACFGEGGASGAGGESGASGVTGVGSGGAPP